LNPQPTIGTLKEQYTRQGIIDTGPGAVSLKHDPFYLKYLYRERLQDVLRYRKISQGDLLDVGCGLGDFCGVAREAGFQVFGTEFTDTVAEHTKRTMGITEIFIGSLKKLNLSKKEFDVISLWHVLEHLTDPFETLICLRTLLKPGGVIAIEVPNVEQNRKRPMYLSDLEDYPIDRLEHLFYFSGRAMQNACMKAGFRILNLNFVDAYQPAKSMYKHLLRKIKRPSKQIVYMGRQNKGFSALRIFLTV
jgi:SAM-dependent methyltransferase